MYLYSYCVLLVCSTWYDVVRCSTMYVQTGQMIDSDCTATMCCACVPHPPMYIYVHMYIVHICIVNCSVCCSTSPLSSLPLFSQYVVPRTSNFDYICVHSMYYVLSQSTSEIGIDRIQPHMLRRYYIVHNSTTVYLVLCATSSTAQLLLSVLLWCVSFRLVRYSLHSTRYII